MPTYREAGVDLDAADRVVSRIGPAVRSTWGDGIVGRFGGFAAGIAMPSGYRDPVLMLSTDGVGTKAELARSTGLVDGLGFDLVAMCVDDLAAAGAVPLALVDYLAIGRLDLEIVSRLVDSIAAACRAAGVALVGGETAEHPGVLAPGQFDLAATALGIVERDGVVDGSEVRPGDRIVGIASPNLRSNGFSLVRALIPDRIDPHGEFAGGGSIAEALLAPSVVYAPAVAGILAQGRPRGLAHITGGGLAGNVGRILIGPCDAVIDTAAWPLPAIFSTVAAACGAPDEELYRTFNMGIGFVIVVAPGEVSAVIDVLAGAGHPAFEIGEIVPGDGTVRLEGIGSG